MFYGHSYSVFIVINTTFYFSLSYILYISAVGEQSPRQLVPRPVVKEQRNQQTFYDCAYSFHLSPTHISWKANHASPKHDCADNHHNLTGLLYIPSSFSPTAVVKTTVSTFHDLYCATSIDFNLSNNLYHHVRANQT